MTTSGATDQAQDLPAGATSELLCVEALVKTIIAAPFRYQKITPPGGIKRAV